jgi:1-acyl-sn-glycerol-3-phosphate acyltransferase
MIRGFLAIVTTCLMVLVGGSALVVIGLFRRSRTAANRVSYTWARSVLAASGVRLTIEGLEHLPEGEASFLIGNHQSALDIPIVIMAFKGDVRFMAKSTLFRIPIFGWALRMYGYVPVDRTRARITLDALNRMYARVGRDPISLVVFPEGTRSSDGRLLPFRRGTMKICRRVGLPVVPFAIAGSHNVTPPGRLRARPGHVRLTFGEPIPAPEVAAMSNEELHDRIRKLIADMLDQPSEAGMPQTISLTAAEGA